MKVSSQNEDTRVATTLHIDFTDTQGQLTPYSVVGSGRNPNLSKILCMSSLPARIKNGHNFSPIIKVKSMQRSGTEDIRTQIQPSKPKWEITNMTDSQITKRTYGQPIEQLLPKRWPLSNRNRTKII